MLRITLALGEYDRTRALIEGSVRAEGLELDLRPMSDAFLRHRLMIEEQAFDACELSLSSYLMAKQRGAPFTAIPVFPYRMFRHGYVLINLSSGIQRPQDLVDKRVGIHMYQATTGLWVRGFLQHDYGVRPNQMRWFTEYPEMLEFAPRDVQMARIPDGQHLEDWLLEGRLDALILIEEVPRELLGHPHVQRLFPDYLQVEREYYLRTRIYPTMHALVARDSVLDESPWVASSVERAFEASKERALEQLRYPRTLTLAWAGAYREQEQEVFGWDPYPNGLEPNRPTLEALCQYSHEQGLTARRFRVEELFFEGTR